MTALFSSPKTPAPQPVPAAPLVDPAQIKQQQDAAAAQQLATQGGGRASTVLNSGGLLGDPGYGKNSAVKVLGGV